MCDKKIITKYDRYYKVRKNLLQSVKGIAKCDTRLLESVTRIRKCGNYDKVRCNLEILCLTVNNIV